MKLDRHHLGAVYRLEFSMVELQHLDDVQMHPPTQQGESTSCMLRKLADVVEHLEKSVPQSKLRYQGDPEF